MFVFDLTSCQSIGKTVKHGGGEYASIVLNELISRGVPFVCVYTTGMDIDSAYLSLCNDNGIKCVDYKESGLISALKSVNCSTFYSALPYTYGSLDFSGIKFIGTIHGLRDLEIQSDKYIHLYEDAPKGYLKSLLKKTKVYRETAYKRSYSRLYQLFKNKSFKYIVVSNHTKYALQSFYPFINPENISVFYSPSVISRADHIQTEEKFYLLVSGNRWLKNSYRALIAIDNLISKGLIKYKTKITGACPKSILKRLKNVSYFEFLPYVSDEELASLMKTAYCFLYPSLNEGFGYPPLQAMGSGTPTIVSACCSMPEVCGPGALYFNPHSITEIENRLLQIENDKLRSTLVEEGYKRFDYITCKQQQDLKDLVDFILS